MQNNSYIIEIHEGCLPHNCLLVLPLSLLRELTPLILDEIRQGEVGSDGSERVVLHLLLAPPKIEELQRAILAYEAAFLKAKRA